MVNQTLTGANKAEVKNLSNWGFVLAMTLAAACWGAGAVISKGVLGYIPPLTLLVVQLVASLIFLWAVIAIKRIPVPRRRETFRLSLIGVLNPGLAYTFSLVGLSLSTASMSALLWAAEPILILGIAWFILRERLTRSLLACSLLALIGVFLVIGASSTIGDSGSLLGNFLILAGVFCCALYTVLTRRDAAQVNPVLLIALQQTAALVWALLIWPLEWGSGGMTTLATINATVWMWALVSGLIYYALAFWFYIIGLKKIPASLAGFFLNLIPIFAVGGAFIFLGERLAVGQWLGAALILVAVVALLRLQSTATFSIPVEESENITGVDKGPAPAESN